MPRIDVRAERELRGVARIGPRIVAAGCAARREEREPERDRVKAKTVG